LFSAAILAAAASFSALRLSAASLRAAIRSASSALLSPPAFCFSFIRAFIAAFSWRMVKGEQLGWRIGWHQSAAAPSPWPSHGESVPLSPRAQRAGQQKREGFWYDGW